MPRASLPTCRSVSRSFSTSAPTSRPPSPRASMSRSSPCTPARSDSPGRLASPQPFATQRNPPPSGSRTPMPTRAVPSNWLTVQIDLADAGVDIMVGTVRPDVADLTDEQLDALASHPRARCGERTRARGGPRHPGGCLPPRRRLRVGTRARGCAVSGARRPRGARVEATDACWVLTSGRPVGRTPGGYAGYLRDGLLTRAEGIRLEAARAARLSA